MGISRKEFLQQRAAELRAICTEEPLINGVTTADRGGDVADQSVFAELQGVEGAISDLSAQTKARACRALGKIQTGYPLPYGICEDENCREKIPPARLAAVPYAEGCVKHQDKILERQRRQFEETGSWEFIQGDPMEEPDAKAMRREDD